MILPHAIARVVVVAAAVVRIAIRAPHGSRSSVRGASFPVSGEGRA